MLPIETVDSSSIAAHLHRGGLEVIDHLADEWRLLCEQAADDQPFFRPEFIRAHVRAISPHSRLAVITVREDGHLRLVLPLIEEFGTFGKIPLRKLRAPVDFNCGRFDAVRSAGPVGDAAIRVAWQYLRTISSWDLLQLCYAQPGSTVSRLTALAQSDGFLTLHASDRPNPYVPLPREPKLLGQLPRNARLRTKLRQVKRQLADLGGFHFHCVTKAEPESLERLFALEASGWKGLNRTAVVTKANVRHFFYELAAVAAHFGYLALYMLELNGELIAAHFALTYKGRCYSPVVAYNEAFSQFSPGHLIVSEILQDCVTRGFDAYDITGQDQEWKMKWTTHILKVNHHYIFRGAAGHLAYHVARRLHPALNSFHSTETIQ